MYSEMTFRHRQSGAALIVALIFLLVMALLGTQSMRTSTMQERMAGNMRDWNLGFQAAEAALRDAESFLVDTVVLPEFNDIDGFYQVNSPHRPAWTGDADAPGNGFVTSDRGGAHVAEAP
jgi:type IV pilus assembly protein PilX